MKPNEFSKPTITEPTRPILSIVELSEQNYEIAQIKLRTLLHLTEQSEFSDGHNTSNDDQMTTILNMIDEIKIHFETTRTLDLLNTITNCPNCGFDLRTRPSRRDRTEPI